MIMMIQQDVMTIPSGQLCCCCGLGKMFAALYPILLKFRLFKLRKREQKKMKKEMYK